ncbi:MAG: 2-hydroxyacyl-CoA dehydratase family protein [Actinomycetota bacterium]|nr:2-hydroxyacyl-CoA dehydratase family protein [Actinomycetota bacterium]MDD5666140.1 2-hydroxyacyl-CoA dehydratase family protein [Actinomycetota bacterium]
MEQTEAWEKMMDTVRDPHPALRERRDAGEKVVGYFCSYVPVELIHAAGAVPVRMLQGPAPGDVAGAYMQPFCCSFARSLLEGLGNGTYDYLSAVVMPHTCDTIRNLSDLVETAAPGLRVMRLMVPTTVHTPEAVDFMVEELAALRPDLEGVTGNEAGGADLRESIRLYNRCRSALDGLREAGPGNRRLYAAYLALQLTGPEEFLDMMGRVEAGGTEAGTRRVAVIGGPVPQLEVFDLLEEYGMRVVWDDLCTASRFAAGMVAEDGEPLRALAERYLGRCPCPTKLDPANRREQELIAGIGESGAEGVVFAQQAFCEFHSFDYPGLKERLDAEGIPSVRLDLEHPFQPTGQMRTRLQALSEILGEGM